MHTPSVGYRSGVHCYSVEGQSTAKPEIYSSFRRRGGGGVSEGCKAVKAAELRVQSNER